MEMKLIEWLVFNENTKKDLYVLWFDEKEALQCQCFTPDENIPVSLLYKEVRDVKIEEDGVEVWVN